MHSRTPRRSPSPALSACAIAPMHPDETEARDVVPKLKIVASPAAFFDDAWRRDYGYYIEPGRMVVGASSGEEMRPGGRRRARPRRRAQGNRGTFLGGEERRLR